MVRVEVRISEGGVGRSNCYRVCLGLSAGGTEPVTNAAISVAAGASTVRHPSPVFAAVMG